MNVGARNNAKRTHSSYGCGSASLPPPFAVLTRLGENELLYVDKKDVPKRVLQREAIS